MEAKRPAINVCERQLMGDVEGIQRGRGRPKEDNEL